MNLRIGSRGSQLALWQANHIAALLRAQGHSVEIQIIKTTGDRLQEVTFAQVGSKGMFTKEIEEALADGRVDLAVHSLKDLPTELPASFTLAATPPRVDPRDVSIAVNYLSLATLPPGARVGTSSPRRRGAVEGALPRSVLNGLIISNDSGFGLLVAEPCSAFHNTITATFIWLSLIKIQRLDFQSKYFVILAIAVAAVVLLNTARIGLMAVSESDYLFWHMGPGLWIVKIVMLSTVLSVFYFGLRPVQQRMAPAA